MPLTVKKTLPKSLKKHLRSVAHADYNSPIALEITQSRAKELHVEAEPAANRKRRRSGAGAEPQGEAKAAAQTERDATRTWGGGPQGPREPGERDEAERRRAGESAEGLANDGAGEFDRSAGSDLDPQRDARKGVRGRWASNPPRRGESREAD